MNCQDSCQKFFQVVKANHVRAVGKCFVRIVVDFKEKSVNADSRRRTRQVFDKFALTGGSFSAAALVKQGTNSL